VKKLSKPKKRISKERSPALKKKGSISPSKSLSPEDKALLKETYGFSQYEASALLSGQTQQASGAGDDQEVSKIALVQFLKSVKPRDELEGMLSAQMIAVHNQAMRSLARFEASTTLQGKKVYGEIAAKLFRVYTAQVEALGRYRNQGKQQVIVKHVHIESGAQAVIGSLTHKSKEPGDQG